MAASSPCRQQTPPPFYIGSMFLFTRAIFGLRRELFLLEDWIESGDREAAIDPEISIVDAHHHLWDARVHEKGWPVSKLTIWILYKLNPRLLNYLMVKSQDPRIVKTFTYKLPMIVPYMLNSMLVDIDNLNQGGEIAPEQNRKGNTSLPAHNIVATVYIESGWKDPKASNKAMEAVPEVAMAQKVAEDSKNRICTGIVGHVDLSEGAVDVRHALLAMIESNPNFRGIRDELAHREGFWPFDTTKGKAYRESFRSGFSVLEELNLSYDTWIYADNIPSLRDLAIAFPRTIIVCNHCGMVGLPPSDPKTALEYWKPVIHDLADACPNVNIKLSGLGMATVGFGFDRRKNPPSSKDLADAWRPFILHCIECFGVDRCMFASNFPVDKVSGGYTQVFNAFKIIVRDFKQEDKQKLFHDNAERVYRLKIRT